jgi:hypothetical protein
MPNSIATIAKNHNIIPNIPAVKASGNIIFLNNFLPLIK